MGESTTVAIHTAAVTLGGMFAGKTVIDSRRPAAGWSMARPARMDNRNQEADAIHRTNDVITDRAYKTFTVGIDETLDRTLDELKEKFGKTSRADVFRMGIALLKVAAEARERDLKLTISDQNDVVRKEIVLP